jgi:hypothetical protein
LEITISVVERLAALVEACSLTELLIPAGKKLDHSKVT